jgi:hypothetical protein
MSPLQIQFLLLTTALFNSLIFRMLHSLSTSNVVIVFAANSFLATAFALGVLAWTGRLRLTLKTISPRVAVPIIVLDLFTDLLDILPLTYPGMNFILHVVLQRLQVFFSILGTRFYDKTRKLGMATEIIPTILSTIGVLAFTLEDVQWVSAPDSSGSRSHWALVFGALSVVLSKACLEVSQQLEMRAVQSGVPKLGVLLLTSVLGGPVGILGYVLQASPGATPHSDASPLVPLLLIGCGRCLYLYLKMVAHAGRISSVTHAFISNLRFTLLLLLGKPDLFAWSRGLWLCVLCSVLGTSVQLWGIRRAEKEKVTCTPSLPEGAKTIIPEDPVEHGISESSHLDGPTRRREKGVRTSGPDGAIEHDHRD